MNAKLSPAAFDIFAWPARPVLPVRGESERHATGSQRRRMTNSARPSRIIVLREFIIAREALPKALNLTNSGTSTAILPANSGVFPLLYNIGRYEQTVVCRRRLSAATAAHRGRFSASDRQIGSARCGRPQALKAKSPDSKGFWRERRVACGWLGPSAEGNSASLPFRRLILPRPLGAFGALSLSTVKRRAKQLRL